MTNEQLAVVIEEITSSVRAIDARFKVGRPEDAKLRTSDLLFRLERDIDILLGKKRKRTDK